MIWLIGSLAFWGVAWWLNVRLSQSRTRAAGFIVPALFAAVAAELVMGDVSVTTFQRTPEQDR